MDEISHFPIPLPWEKIRRRLKIPPQSDFKAYDPLIEKFFPLIETHGRFDDLKIGIQGNRIQFGNEWVAVSESLASHLLGCSKVSMMGVTVGRFLEAEIETYSRQSKILEPLILDAVGSECVEEAAIFISGLIGEKIKKRHFSPTKRFSPGYGDLSLEVQKFFFERLRLDEIGMVLNPHFLMIPEKSITAFIGWQEKIKK